MRLIGWSEDEHFLLHEGGPGLANYPMCSMQPHQRHPVMDNGEESTPSQFSDHAEEETRPVAVIRPRRFTSSQLLTEYSSRERF
jgi:hypothetical protein